MARVIFHVDMDAFFASVEQHDQPELKGKPVIVGGSPESRGVVCAASYEARKFGVRSAIPCATAIRLCPEGIFIPPRMGRYREISRAVMTILRNVSQTLEKMSVDEAYLDVSSHFSGQDTEEALYESVSLARKIKDEIFETTGLKASIGIASNKLLAKLSSDFDKPDGLIMIPERDKSAFLRTLSVHQLHGVGKVTATTLNRNGIHLIADLQDFKGDLRPLIGSFGSQLKQYAYGEDPRPVETEHEVKSISAEETFAKDTSDRPLLRSVLKEQASEIEERLTTLSIAANTVQVKVRYADFTTLTRQIRTDEPIACSKEIYRTACLLLGRHGLVSRPLRLIGLGVSGLTPPNQQLKLAFEDNSPQE